MNEIKSPRKQQITYFLLVAVVMILLNSMVMPYLQNAQITETDYNTFINMTENGQVGSGDLILPDPVHGHGGQGLRDRAGIGPGSGQPAP